jgi:hypothetical protein
MGSGVLPGSSPDFAGNSGLRASVVPDKDTANQRSPRTSGDQPRRARLKKNRTGVEDGPGRICIPFTCPGERGLRRSGLGWDEQSIERGVNSHLVPEQITSTPTSGTKWQTRPEQLFGSPDKQVPSAETKASPVGHLMVTSSGGEEPVKSRPAHRGPEDKSGHSMA